MKAKITVEKPPTKCCGLLSVRILTALMCAVLIIFATTTALLVTLHFSLEATNDLASIYSAAMAVKAKSDVEYFLNRPLYIAMGWQVAFSQERPLPKDEESQNPLWYIDYWNSFVAAMRGSEFNYIVVVMRFADGNRVLCANMIDNPAMSNTANERFICRSIMWGKRSLSDKKATSSELIRTFARSDFSSLSDTFIKTKDNAPESYWYKLVPHKPGENMWSNVKLAVVKSQAQVGVSTAVFNDTGTMLGVISIGLSLAKLDAYIDRIIITENSVCVLVDNDAILLGTSHSIPYMTRQDISSSYSETLPKNCLKSKTVLVCRDTVASYPYPPLNELEASNPEIIHEGTDGDSPVMLLVTP